jgi:hypothetical protein
LSFYNHEAAGGDEPRNPFHSRYVLSIVPRIEFLLFIRRYIVSYCEENFCIRYLIVFLLRIDLLIDATGASWELRSYGFKAVGRKGSFPISKL